MTRRYWPTMDMLSWVLADGYPSCVRWLWTVAAVGGVWTGTAQSHSSEAGRARHGLQWCVIGGEALICGSPLRCLLSVNEVVNNVSEQDTFSIVQSYSFSFSLLFGLMYTVFFNMNSLSSIDLSDGDISAKPSCCSILFSLPCFPLHERKKPLRQDAHLQSHSHPFNLFWLCAN